MTNKLDWSKPIQRRDGRDVEVVKVHNDGRRTVYLLGQDICYTVYSTGRYGCGPPDSTSDIINKLEEPPAEIFVNFYKCMEPAAHKDKLSAVIGAGQLAKFVAVRYVIDPEWRP